MLAAQCALGLLHLAAKLLHSAHVLAGILAGLLLVQLEEVLHHALVKVLASEMSVAVGGDDLEHSVVDREQRDIERTAAEIEHKNVLLRLALVHAVRDGGRRGLVDDAEDVEAGNRASILGGGALGVVEVGGHGHDGVDNLLAKVGLGDLLHLDEHHGADLLGRELLVLAVNLHQNVRLVVAVDNAERPCLGVALDGWVVPRAADETLGIEDGVLGVQGQLVLGGVANQALALLGEGDVAGGDAVSLVVGDDLHAAVLEHADAGVGGAEIDTNHGAEVALVVRGVHGDERSSKQSHEGKLEHLQEEGVSRSANECCAWRGKGGESAGVTVKPPRVTRGTL